MNIFLGVLIGLFVLMFLVTAHEFGHFIMARKNGVTVKEFGIGFPPRAIAWIKGEDGKWHKIPKKDWKNDQNSLIFSLNWLPIGGFCQMDGESDADTKKGTFGASSYLAKTKILFGGVAMNWLIALIVLTILAWTGMPQFINNQFHIDNDSQIVSSEPVLVTEVIENSPAAKAGIQPQDQIIAVNDQMVSTGTDIVNINNEHAEETLSYKILRDGSEQNINITLNKAGSEYLAGISMSSGQTMVRSTWSAPIVGIVTTAQLTGETFRSLGEMLWNLCTGIARQISFDGNVREQGREAIGAVGDSVSGPVGIVGVIFPAFTETGIPNLAFLAALISVSLACMNVLPIPALDGGRWLLITIYRLRKKKLTKEAEERIVAKAFIVLLALIAIVTILDIMRLF